MKNLFFKLVATFFGVGYLPLVPGTFGSLAGLAIYLYIRSNAAVYGGVLAILILLGFGCAGQAERILGQKDHRAIVIDEVAGMLLSLCFIPFDLKWLIIGFFLFRLLDTLKPYPAGKIQNIPGSTGVMGDDIIAGIYTNLILQLVFRWASLRTL